MTEKRSATVAPSGYEQFNDPPPLKHCWDGKYMNLDVIAVIATCCWCGIPQNTISQREPLPEHGPFFPRPFDVYIDHTDAPCPRRER